MTADPKRLTFESPAEIIAELHAKAKHVGNCDGFNGGEFQLWATAGGPLLVFLAPDGDVEFFRSFGSTWARSPRNLGRILRGQDGEPDHTGVDNSSFESSNADSSERKS
jgi:hypothetical protein